MLLMRVQGGGLEGPLRTPAGQMTQASLSWYVALKVVPGGRYSSKCATLESLDVHSFSPQPTPSLPRGSLSPPGEEPIIAESQRSPFGPRKSSGSVTPAPVLAQTPETGMLFQRSMSGELACPHASPAPSFPQQ